MINIKTKSAFYIELCHTTEGVYLNEV